ncbi:MAG: transposase family protein [Capsulimonadaceae bacterium]|nr:transposase family protein [Capsulimonadaceae bacterium]
MVPDKSMTQMQRHGRTDLLFACIHGCNDCTAFADFAKHNLDCLRQYIPPTGGAPSHGSFSHEQRLFDPVSL